MPLPAPSASVEVALRRSAAINPYFAVRVRGERDHSPGWQPLADVVTGGDGLDDLLTLVENRLQHTDRRVIASIMFQGYAARLWSPTLACVTLHGILPDLSPGLLSWRYPEGELVDLSLSSVTGWQVAAVDPGPADEVVYAAVVEKHLIPLMGTLRSRVAISERLLWGNAASTLVGAATMIGPAATPLLSRLLGHGGLAGTGVFVRAVDTAAADIGGRFHRHSCCMFYRVAGAGMCGDCVLNRRTTLAGARTPASVPLPRG